MSLFSRIIVSAAAVAAASVSPASAGEKSASASLRTDLYVCDGAESERSSKAAANARVRYVTAAQVAAGSVATMPRQRLCITSPELAKLRQLRPVTLPSDGLKLARN